ncbi:MAG: ParB/RepB/Spo0J family partition protein [Oscillospiraceae bacterium]|nr:ParB/RepB/Spo0J family partition protein [Oscillospiraceae bacterium]
MAKKNYRCPLQEECERSCKFHGRELDCDYYDNNARGDYVLEDQEERRAQREREWDEQFYENLLDEVEDEEEEEKATSDRFADVGKLIMLPVDKIHPHPDNPRKDLGDLTELAESIKANGVLQNLTVVKRYGEIRGEWHGMYTVIIGHRRLAASKLAGLKEVPCVVVEMTPAEQFATMMVENVQRSDLTVYEQAQGFQTMLNLGGTVEEVARQTGFSQSTVRRRLNLMKLDQKKFKDSMSRSATLTDYMELDKIKDDARRNKVLEEIGTPNFKAALKSALAQEEIEQKIAHWESLVSPFAKKVPQRPSVGDHVMVKQFTKYSTEAEEVFTAPDDSDTEEYLYFVDKSFGVYLYKTKEEDPEETEQQRIRKERAERFDRLKAEFEEMSDLHHLLREEFLMGFNPTTRAHKEAIQVYAMRVIIHLQARWAKVNWEHVGNLLNIEVEDGEPDEAEFEDVVKYNPARALMAVAYSYAISSMSCNYWTYAYGEDCRFIKPMENKLLDYLYELLIALGYEMSDEELQMQNGTHELFSRAYE